MTDDEVARGLWRAGFSKDAIEVVLVVRRHESHEAAAEELGIGPGRLKHYLWQLRQTLHALGRFDLMGEIDGVGGS